MKRVAMGAVMGLTLLDTQAYGQQIAGDVLNYFVCTAKESVSAAYKLSVKYPNNFDLALVAMAEHELPCYIMAMYHANVFITGTMEQPEGLQDLIEIKVGQVVLYSWTVHIQQNNSPASKPAQRKLQQGI